MAHRSFSNIIFLLLLGVAVQWLAFPETLFQDVGPLKAQFTKSADMDDIIQFGGCLLFALGLMLCGVNWNPRNGKLAGIGSFITAGHTAYSTFRADGDVFVLRFFYIYAAVILLCAIHIFAFPSNLVVVGTPTLGNKNNHGNFADIVTFFADVFALLLFQFAMVSLFWPEHLFLDFGPIKAQFRLQTVGLVSMIRFVACLMMTIGLTFYSIKWNPVSGKTAGFGGFLAVGFTSYYSYSSKSHIELCMFYIYSAVLFLAALHVFAFSSNPRSQKEAACPVVHSCDEADVKEASISHDDVFEASKSCGGINDLDALHEAVAAHQGGPLTSLIGRSDLHSDASPETGQNKKARACNVGNEWRRLEPEIAQQSWDEIIDLDDAVLSNLSVESSYRYRHPPAEQAPMPEGDVAVLDGSDSEDEAPDSEGDTILPASRGSDCEESCMVPGLEVKYTLQGLLEERVQVSQVGLCSHRRLLSEQAVKPDGDSDIDSPSGADSDDGGGLEEDLCGDDLDERPEMWLEKGCRYSGQWRGAERHGHGIWTGPDGDCYEGQLRRSMPHGHGVMEELDGSRYDGSWEANERHGHGACSDPDGVTYIGQWVHNVKSGIGTESWPDGLEYCGGWSEGVKHGFGGLTFSEGEEYVGEFREDTMHGEGRYIFASGRQYVGQWNMIKMHGRGKTEWPNGATHEGFYANNLRCGEGTLTKPDGSKYVGQWLVGKKHGSGYNIDAEGILTDGTWDMGRFQK